MSQRPSERRRTSWIAWALGLISAAYLVWLLIISIGQAADAEAAGYVVGTLVAAFLAALVLRFIFVKLRPAESRPSFWSPWVIVLTAIVLILSRAGDVLSRAS